MALQIYNTLTRMKEQFVTQEPGKASVYVCGPTVYGYIHIGNARPMIFFDVVRSYLENQKYDVNFVVNFTDVDDKLIRKAEEMDLSVPEVASMFIDAYYEDLEGLGIPRATSNPRVTENMDIIIEFIRDLESKGYAYEKGGDVFFRTGKFEGYGKLSGQNIGELQFGIRIDVDERKENPEDFVLWKAAKPGEIHWDSPWGPGRPGWHIECSAMSRHLLGDTLDIHGGGQDLQFPHHECEVAQSEAVTGKPLASYWMHNGYINIGGEKMSKSLGNGVLVKDLRSKYKREAIRYFMLTTHYRNPLNFTDESMMQAERGVERIANALGNLRYRLQESAGSGEGTAVTKEWERKLQDIRTAFHTKMQDDFNTPDAITAVFEWVSEVNGLLQSSEVSHADLEAALTLFEEMNGVLRIAAEEEQELLDEEIEALIEERTEARKSKNWARADEIRDLLQEQGILLEDTPQGMRWRRK
ncbi:MULTISPECIES: cysteine--tRNA ligase [Paenibacillus]|uniref:Cysteine--tRNA ligase n=1 Tax=Paenibacillus vini TaxID=1476024 RepID=A0ABQ4MIC2_9BACL|nr:MULTISPECIES: cysteine--tRNA ligase [Paenibacillus]MBQ4901699.1 cysteine--tRNA ligase [Paenibacillus sp. Marseille-P2973]MDN4069175.1 cysteine--tRNA ligase [Paenibacillus vini]GIP55733.1 cysteine--tRNA ligase [Paenibacillus vini]